MEITMALQLCAMLVLILVAAEVFTNALEHLGERLRISEGVTGSLFAAVGTAMPESMVPLLALFAGTESAQINQEIGVGAILGAPLMLSTLSLGLMSLSVIRQRGLAGELTPERTGISRDLNFFLLAFVIAASVLFLPREPHYFMTLRAFLGSTLVLLYFFYVMLTLEVSAQLVRDGHGTQAHTEMLLCRLGLPDHMAVIVLQILFGLALLIAGAEGFIHGIEAVSKALGVSALLLSLLIVPIATELPEKVNSILWIRRRKDTLAFGNITGAMVFQGTILPAIGILLTPWDLRVEVLVGIAITLLAALWLRILLLAGYFRIWDLMVNGALYVAYLILMLGL
ncbi:MAG: sodium:calcium antiporter [Pseudomonadota bacterium]|nr:sodium:calcium antiporter [Pseudomonadota bacterium]